MTKQRTKQWGATTTVTTPNWQPTGRTQKALNRSKCFEVTICVVEKEALLTFQPPNAENRTFGGVGGCRGAIPGTRPDLRCGVPDDHPLLTESMQFNSSGAQPPRLLSDAPSRRTRAHGETPKGGWMPHARSGPRGRDPLRPGRARSPFQLHGFG